MSKYTFTITEPRKDSFRVYFKYNGKKIFFSESLTSKQNAFGNIASSRSNADAPTVDTTLGESRKGKRFEIVEGRGSKAGEYYVRFFAANGEMLSHTEHYTTKANAENAIYAMQCNAAEAKTKDETVDHRSTA